MARYIYFKKSGKYYSEGEGPDMPVGMMAFQFTRDVIMQMNRGKMPGLIPGNRGSEYYVVLSDDNNFFAHMLLPEDVN